MTIKTLIKSGAVFSPDRRYRYGLHRAWDDGLPKLTIVALNPATATTHGKDRTILRCRAFAGRWGYGSLIMVNLFAFCSTTPKGLRGVKGGARGPDNDKWLKICHEYADTTVAAWGNGGALWNRGQEVKSMLTPMWCLGLTKAGHPMFPLYRRADTERVPFC